MHSQNAWRRCVAGIPLQNGASDLGKVLFGLTHRRGLASVPARLHVGLNILRSSNRRMLSTDSTLASRINSLVRQNNGGRLPSQQVKGQGRRNISFMSERRLMRLEQEADANPTNAKKQLEYLRELVKEDPAEVVRRYESGHFASSDLCFREYMKALVMTNKIDKVDLAKTLQQTSEVAGAATTTGGTHSTYTGVGMEGRPMHVVMQEPGMKSQIFRAVRGLISLIVTVSLISVLMEERVGKAGMSIHNEIEPQAQTKQYKFEDVRGCDEAKEELVEIVEFLRNPSKFTRLGGKLPKGVLLYGPPGTGKTLLARAIAGEANVPFFYCSGSEFDEMFVGVGARRVRELFAAAKKRHPCIIFIDEIDAIGGTRNPKDQNYVRMTLNQLLVELDGFSQNDGVIVIGATNFPELLDKALVRPGRFDKHVVVPMPDVQGRFDILELHMKGIPRAPGVDLKTIARATPGLSGAELANVVNQAALKASMDGEEAVNMSHLEYAKDKILMGAERKSAVIDEKNRRLVAYHEGGHALVAMHTDGAMPVHKATIMPRGRALGMVAQLPETDELSWTRKQLLARLNVCMGGRAAEEMVFGEDNITSGASNDIEQATQLAHTMVTKYGMSDKVGLVLHRDDEAHSPDTQSAIEQEVRRLCQTAYANARRILTQHRDQLERVASALLEYETLTSEEIKTVMKGEKLNKEIGPAPESRGKSTSAPSPILPLKPVNPSPIPAQA